MHPKLSLACGLSLLSACVMSANASATESTALSLAKTSTTIETLGTGSTLTLNAPAGAHVTVTVYPYSDLGLPLSSPVTTATATASSASVANVTLKALPIGFYQVKVKAGDSDIDTSIAVIPSGIPKNSDEGVITHFAMGRGELPRSLQLIRAAGFGWIRDEMYWSAIELARGVYTFPAVYDTYVNDALKLGLSPLVVLDYANRFYPYPTGVAGTKGLMTDDQRAGYAAYAKAVAAKFKGRVSAFEVWNEPVPAAFGTSDWTGYLKLLEKAYPAIKAGNPSATVISCGGGGPGGGVDASCASAIIHLGGAAYQDVYSMHPYMAPYDPDTGYGVYNSPLGKTVSVQNIAHYLVGYSKYHTRPNNQPLPMWATEVGWNSAPVKVANGETVEAAYAARTFIDARRFGLAQKLFWYDFQDDGVDPSNKEDNFGFIHLDFSPKPAYVATAIMHNELRDATFQSAPVDETNVKVLKFSGSQGQVYVGYTVGLTASNAEVTVPDGTYIETDWQGKQTTVTVSGQSLNWKLGPQPRYLQKK